jgi:thioredoxin-related protein
MSKYGVSGFPTIKYTKSDGTAFGGFVGYMPTDQVTASMDAAKGG